MGYYIAKTVNMDFDRAVQAVTATLKEQGFGIITEIDMRATLKSKIDKDIPAYQILGACSPELAYEAVLKEPQIGLMLPCNVIVRQLENNEVEVAAIDPVASMMAIDNDALKEFAVRVKTKMQLAIDAL